MDKNEVLEIFFGMKQGELPESLNELHAEYITQLSGKGCSKCKENSIKRHFKSKVLEIL